jgi:hypothetical protein
MEGIQIVDEWKIFVPNVLSSYANDVCVTERMSWCRWIQRIAFAFLDAVDATSFSLLKGSALRTLFSLRASPSIACVPID